MLDDFMTRAALAAVAAALVAGPLGCFVVWRRMAFFGDATAHSALLGVALGIALEIPILAGVLAIAVAMAVGVSALATRETIAVDTLLGVFSHAALAIGLVAISLTPGVRVDLMGYLFGDILAVSRSDLAMIWVGAVLVGAVVAWRWRALVNSTLSGPLAVAEGGDPNAARLLLTLSLALIIAISMQVVGLLLVTSLLILPAAAARPMARTPEGMAVIAALLGAGGALAGLYGSEAFDTPSGPMIVTTLFGLFCAVHAVVAAQRLRAGLKGDQETAPHRH